MAKRVAAEVLVDLRRRLDRLPPRDSERARLVQNEDPASPLSEELTFTVANDGEVPDQLTADAYRSIIGGWVIDELIRQKLAQDGIAITDDDRTNAQTKLDQALAGATDVPESVTEFELDSAIAREAFGRTQAQGSLGEFANATAIEIDPRYGYWDAATGTILPMQS